MDLFQLAEALVKNCDLTVHREISSRMFTNALTKMIHDKVRNFYELLKEQCK